MGRGETVDFLCCHAYLCCRVRCPLENLQVDAAVREHEREGWVFGEHSIRYFDGGLFNDASVIKLDVADLGILYEVSKNYDWSHVAPAIFGTLLSGRSIRNGARRFVL